MGLQNNLRQVTHPLVEPFCPVAVEQCSSIYLKLAHSSMPQEIS